MPNKAIKNRQLAGWTSVALLVLRFFATLAQNVYICPDKNTNLPQIAALVFKKLSDSVLHRQLAKL